MTLHIYLLAGLFLTATSCLVSAGFVLFAMIGEVNRKLPEQNQISYLFGHSDKYSYIHKEYRRLYPKGRLLLYLKILLATGFGLLLVFAWRFGMFGGAN